MNQGYGGGMPDTYVPSGHLGALGGGGYGIPQQQSGGFMSSMGGGGSGGGGNAMGGGAPWLGGGGGGGIGGSIGSDQWPGMNDATTQMGVQFSKHAFSAGSAYLDKNFLRLLPLQHLKHSFNVSNEYVLNKLRLVLWPWRHRVWSRSVRRSETSGLGEGWKAPRDDINCPDLYIPGKTYSSSYSDPH